MKAVGVHDHPTRKLGRRPALVTRPKLNFREHVVTIPPHPIADPPPNLTWPMDMNDQWGDCVVAGSDHALQAIYTALTGSYTNWSTDQILAYYRTQNPTFDPSSSTNGPGSNADGGMNVQLFLEQLVKDGVILGFAGVDPTNEEEVKAACYIGLGLVCGATLDNVQQSQAVWDYVSGSPVWGGHCFAEVGYLGSPDENVEISWGEAIPATQAFENNQVSEVWFVLTQAHVDHPGFRDDFDLGSFAAAYSDITGKPFPVVVPPPAPPAPGPTPSPPSPHPHRHHPKHWWDWLDPDGA